MPVEDPNVGLALALTFAAGAATAVGACVVFVPRLVRLASRRTLAAALALSAGVMTYVSFIEIMGLSLKKFVESGRDHDMAYLYSTLSFFAGVVVMMILNFIVTYLLGGHHHHGHGDHHHHGPDNHRNHDHHADLHDHEHGVCGSGGTRQCTQSSIQEEQKEGEAEEVAVGCACCSDDPVADLEKLQRMAEAMELLDEKQQQTNIGEGDKEEITSGVDGDQTKGHQLASTEPKNDDLEGQPGNGIGAETGDADDDEDDGEDKDGEQHLMDADGGEQRRREEARQKEQQKLMRMSINTAVAIALHNFPEGLVTFLSTLADPKVGAILCVAIAIHNIPEGICVAMPIYYATGNRWKAFGWAVLSGMSEPFAALLGWAVLATLFSDTLYAVMFGVVAGMMVIISVRELLPTAHRYDPDDTVVTYFFILGMVIMALSLVLFLI